jgi:hypothetical protein
MKTTKEQYNEFNKKMNEFDIKINELLNKIELKNKINCNYCNIKLTEKYRICDCRRCED